MTADAAQIWKKLTPSQRVTLLAEAGHSHYGYGEEALHRAGLKKRSHLIPALISGTARHALGRKGLLDVGRTVAAPTTAAGFHTPREVTAIGRAVAEHGMTILRTPPGREGGTVHAKKKKLSKTDAIEAVRRIMRSTGFDEEEVYGGEANQIHFASREEGDVLEGRADPGITRFAREKVKEIESAVPGAKARAYTVDEWVSIEVTLPNGAPPAAKPAKPAKPPAETEPPPEWAQRAKEKATKYLKPGDEIEYTNFTVGGSYKGKAIVTWDHGKSVEARSLGGEKLRLERASDGSLRRFT